jgi:hypothetical protein
MRGRIRRAFKNLANRLSNTKLEKSNLILTNSSEKLLTFSNATYKLLSDRNKNGTGLSSKDKMKKSDNSKPSYRKLTFEKNDSKDFSYLPKPIILPQLIL